MPQQLIAGVDEAGRGPLAGAVYASAVILDSTRPISGLNDSKQLSEKKRETLFPIIKQQALGWAIATASAKEIDELNIHYATLLAMKRAVLALSTEPATILVDGRFTPETPYAAKAIIKGDSLYSEISAASILAKVERDRAMLLLDEQYPEYGFAKHKGYPTKQHLQALASHGPCPEHRQSYAPVSRMIVTHDII